MTLGTLASVFQRIDAIEARFARAPQPPVGSTSVASGPDFDSLLERNISGADPFAGGATDLDTPYGVGVDQLAAVGALAPSSGFGTAAPTSLFSQLDRLAAAGALPIGQTTAGVPGSPGHDHGVGALGDAAVATAAAPSSVAALTAGSVAPDTPFATEFERAGSRHGVPPRLLAAVGWVESRYQTDVVSPDGALGIMQFMPMTAQELGVDPYDPVAAIDGAARLLAQHQRKFGSWDLALAAYHSGAGAVSRAGNQPPTRAATYVELVHDRLENA